MPETFKTVNVFLHYCLYMTIAVVSIANLRRCPPGQHHQELSFQELYFPYDASSSTYIFLCSPHYAPTESSPRPSLTILIDLA